MTVGAFLKSLNIPAFVFCDIQVKGIITVPAPVTEPFNFSKINRIWVGKISYCRIVWVFCDWCCVSACAVICISVKRIGDRTVPCGEPVREIEREDESAAWWRTVSLRTGWQESRQSRKISFGLTSSFKSVHAWHTWVTEFKRTKLSRRRGILNLDCQSSRLIIPLLCLFRLSGDYRSCTLYISPWPAPDSMESGSERQLTGGVFPGAVWSIQSRVRLPCQWLFGWHHPGRPTCYCSST